MTCLRNGAQFFLQNTFWTMLSWACTKEQDMKKYSQPQSQFRMRIRSVGPKIIMKQSIITRIDSSSNFWKLFIFMSIKETKNPNKKKVVHDPNWLWSEKERERSDLICYPQSKGKIYDDRTQDGLWLAGCSFVSCSLAQLSWEDLQDNALIDSQLLL